jgi:dTDP-4-dehydrorhamnose 3,5-epimerase-like enzyme
MKAILQEGSSFTDNRGTLRFVNEKVPGNYRRFYLMTHTDTTVIRAWQGHRQEEKAFYTICGNFVIAIVHPASFDEPGDDEIPEFFRLTQENNSFLRVPGGCYTGIKALTSNSTLLVLSAFDFAGSKADDYRQPSHKWVDWSLIT